MQNKAKERNMNTKTRKRSSSRPIYTHCVFVDNAYTYVYPRTMNRFASVVYLFIFNFPLDVVAFFYSIIALRYFGGGHIIQINVHVAILFIHFRGFSLSRCGYVSCIERVISVQGLRDSSRPWCVDSYFFEQLNA